MMRDAPNGNKIDASLLPGNGVRNDGPWKSIEKALIKTVKPKNMGRSASKSLFLLVTFFLSTNVCNR